MREGRAEAVRVTLEMPCAILGGASPLGIVWSESAVEGIAKSINEGVGPSGVRPDGLFKDMGLRVEPVRGTAKVDRSRRHVNGYLYVVFEAEVPDSAEISKMGTFGISMV